MAWFWEHPLVTAYLTVCLAWGLWQVIRAARGPLRMRPRQGVVMLLLSPILLPLRLFSSRDSEPAWMQLRWKCPNCAWAMFDEVCEHCGADGLPYDPVAQRAIEDDPPRSE